MAWHNQKGIGWVNLNTRGPTGAKSERASVEGPKLTTRRRILGVPTTRESPLSKWRVSKYMKYGTKRPKHPRVKLRETVAREAREIQDFARKHSMAAIQLAAQIMADPSAPESARLQAMDLVLNRAYGKPNQTNTNLNVDANGKPREVSSSELDRRIEEALGSIEAIAGRAGQAAKGKERSVDLRQRHRNPDGSEPQLN